MTTKIGQQVPTFPVLTSEGEEVSLADYQGKAIVLYFYPKDNTPGCTTQACSFRDDYESFADLNAEIIGVSPDSATSHQNFKQKHDLPFTLIVDEDHKLAEAFGAWILKKKPDREYYGNERVTFIIDKDGIIREEYRKVKVDGHTEEALQFIREHLQ